MCASAIWSAKIAFRQRLCIAVCDTAGRLGTPQLNHHHPQMSTQQRVVGSCTFLSGQLDAMAIWQAQVALKQHVCIALEVSAAQGRASTVLPSMVTMDPGCRLLLDLPKALQ
jgi:hypothetical protein